VIDVDFTVDVPYQRIILNLKWDDPLSPLRLFFAVLKRTLPGKLRHLTISNYNWFVVLAISPQLQHKLQDLIRPTSVVIFPRESRKHENILRTSYETGLMLSSYTSITSNAISSVTHLEFENSAAFLRWDIALHAFPRVTHIACTLAPDTVVHAEQVLREYGHFAWSNPSVQLAVVHAVELDSSKWEDRQKSWETLIEGMRWPSGRWAVLVDDLQFRTPMDGEDVWSRAITQSEIRSLVPRR
jgi:hypothetical protein